MCACHLADKFAVSLMPYPVGYEVLVKSEIVPRGQSSQVRARFFRRAFFHRKTSFDQEPVCEIVTDGLAFHKVFNRSQIDPG